VFDKTGRAPLISFSCELVAHDRGGAAMFKEDFAGGAAIIGTASPSSGHGAAEILTARAGTARLGE
jgi:hypothetical protein